MIDSTYLMYIPDPKKDECHRNLMNDIYYFYHGVKPNENQIIVCMNSNIFDLDKKNLKVVNI